MLLLKILLIILILLILIGFITFITLYHKGNKSFFVNIKANLPKGVYSFDLPISKLYDNKDNYEEVYCNCDGLKLHAYEFKQTDYADKPWVIIIHGYNGKAQTMSRQLDHFYSNSKYNVLCIDLRCFGQSDGKYIGMGYLERLDVVAWINYLSNKYNNPKILLYGESMGAATVMQTTGEQLPANVVCAIEDCGFSSTWEQMVFQSKNVLHLPAFPILHIINFFCKNIAKFDSKNNTPLDAVKRSNTPTLFIHGDDDTFVPYYMHDIIYSNANCPKDKLVVKGAGHIYSNIVSPEEYWNKVDSFVKKYIK